MGLRPALLVALSLVALSSCIGDTAGADMALRVKAKAKAQNTVPFVCLSADYREDFTVPAEVDLIGRFDHLDVDFPFRRKADVTTVVNGAALP